MTKKAFLKEQINWALDNSRFDLQLFATPNPDNLMVGRGKAFFRLWLLGKPTYFRNMGLIESLDITPAIEEITKMNTMYAQSETYKKLIKSVSYDLAIKMAEYDEFNLALALYGQNGVEVQEEKTVSGETYKASPGTVISVPYKMITNVAIAPLVPLPAFIGPAKLYAVSVNGGTGKITTSGTYTGTNESKIYITITNANSTTGTITDVKFTWKDGFGGVESAEIDVTGAPQVISDGVSVSFAAAAAGQDFVEGEIYEIEVRPAQSEYIAGTDYTVDETQLRGGMISIPDTSSIPENSQVRVSYKVPEAKFPKIMGGAVKTIEGDFMFVGDPMSGRPWIVEVWHVVISPTEGVGLITDEWGSLTIKATLLSDRKNHPNEPYFKAVGVA